MTTKTGDIIRVILKGGYGGQAMRNVFHMRITTNNADENLLPAFGISFAKYIITPMRPMFASSMVYTEVEAINLSETFRPFYRHIINIAGTATGEPAPTFLAFQFKQNVGTRKTRAGFKRFSGCTESAFSGNLWLAGFLALGNGMAGAFSNPMTIENPSNTVVGNAEHIVLKNISDSVPTADDWQRVLSSDFIDRPTTQNTRKNRGA